VGPSWDELHIGEPRQGPQGRGHWQVWLSRLDCADVEDNHSADRIVVWHGRPEPLLVCGFHESRDDVMRALYARKGAPQAFVPPF
jgi:hypothetical protein